MESQRVGLDLATEQQPKNRIPSTDESLLTFWNEVKEKC